MSEIFIFIKQKFLEVCGLLPILFCVLLPFIYYYSELSAVIMFAVFVNIAFIIRLISSKQIMIGAIEKKIWIVSILWLLTLGISIFGSVEPTISLIAFAKIVSLVVFSFLIRVICAENSNRNTLFRVAIWVAIIHSSACFYEYAVGAPVPATWIDPGMKDLIRTRCSGFFVDPNIFGAFLSSVFFLGIGQLAICKNIFNKMFSQIGLIMCGSALFMTLSRGAWVGCAAGFSIFCIMMFWKVKDNCLLKSLVVVVGILCIVFLSGPFKYRLMSLTNTKDMTISQRSLINKGIFSSLTKIPLTGFGLHSFNQVYPQFRVVGGDYPMNAHNEFLQSLIETGPLSVVLMLLFIFYLLLAIFKQKNISFHTAIFTASFVSLLVHNLTGFSSRILLTAIMISLSVGGIIASLNEESKPKAMKSAVKYCLIFLSILTMCASMYGHVLNSGIVNVDNCLYDNKPDQALKIVLYLENIAPSFANLQISKYKIMKKLGRNKEAMQCLEKASKINPSEASFWILYASNSRNKDKITEYFNIALKLDPASEIYRFYFARFLYDIGHFSDALMQLDVALKYSPGHFDVYKNYKRIVELKEKILKKL